MQVAVELSADAQSCQSVKSLQTHGSYVCLVAYQKNFTAHSLFEIKKERKRKEEKPNLSKGMVEMKSPVFSSLSVHVCNESRRLLPLFPPISTLLSRLPSINFGERYLGNRKCTPDE